MRFMKTFFACAMLLCMFAFAPITGNAAQYNAGSENADVADLSDGFTLRLYNSFYGSDTLKDQNGDKVGDLDLFSYTAMARAYYMTDFCFLGAKYGASIGIPFGYTDVEFNGFKGDDGNLGDMYIEPVILNWTQPNFDVFLTMGMFAPTGAFDADDAINIGHGYWTFMPSVGGRVYFDAEKTWAAYAVARYEMNTEQEDTNMTFGDVLTGEYGLTKAIPFGKDKLTLGAVGYTQVQTTENDFDGKTIKDAETFVTALGPAVGYHFDSIGLDVGAKVFFEMAAENQPEGVKGIISVSKAF